MAISTGDVKALREKTGAGMMDCKKVICVVRDNTAAMVEVNSETDFVAKNDDFKDFVKDVAEHIISQPSHSDKEESDAGEKLANEAWFKTPDRKVSDILADKIATIGENIKIRRFSSFVAKSGGIATYIHGGGKIGVMVEYKTENNSDEINSVVRDVAMHVAAINPQFLTSESVTEEDIRREEAIYRKQLIEQGKPEKILDKIVKGKMGKFYSEVCLLEQPFVKDPSMSVKKYLEEKGKSTGSKIEIVRYSRFQVGEGLESKE